MRIYEFRGKTSKEHKVKHRGKAKEIIRAKRVAIALVVIFVVTLVYTYINNMEVRKWVDKNIFRKEITNENVVTIEVDSDSNLYMYAYDKYVITLNKNNIKAYSGSGKKEMDIDVSVTKPIFSSSNRFLAVAENYGKKLYLISSSGIIWENSLEGEISRINVNKNGYVSVTLTKTGYKTEIVTFNPEGKELFKVYLASTYGIDMDISDDNKYLAIAEINSSGTVIQSNIRIVSIEKAQDSVEKENAIIYAYTSDSNEMITNIKYQGKDKLICMYDSKIKIIQINSNKEHSNIDFVEFDTDTIFADVNLSENIVKVRKVQSGIFNVEAEVRNN